MNNVRETDYSIYCTKQVTNQISFAFSAIAEVYQKEGDKEYTRKDVCNAIYFYTEGIQVSCKDVQLNAKLYSNRATAYYHFGKK